MSDWSQGYVTEVSYTHGYYRELTPSVLGLSALAQGLAGPGLGTKSLRILELGCGQGFSANVIAAANPHVDYTAVDFNPAHILGAEGLRAEAGTPNLRFLESSFEDIAADASLGTFDVITLHGIYTWVSAENREHIIRIAREKLRNGGALYLSYNTFPGWTPILPIRRMMTDTAASTPGAPIFDRLAEGFKLFERLNDVGARYIAGTPGLVDRVRKFKTLQQNYVAHEYLNGEWTVFHFADVAADMARAKLTFAGSAHLLDLLDGLNLSAEQAALLTEVKDPVRREGLRDLIVNQQFRRDIFLRGSLGLTVTQARQRWLEQRFALLRPAAAISRKVAIARGEAELQAEIYDPILARLEAGPQTVQALVADPAIAALGWQKLTQALVVLAGQGNLVPALPEAGEREREKRTDAFNLAVINRARDSADLTHLASPVTGSGVPVDRLVQLWLLAGRQKIGDRPQFVWDALKARQQRVIKDGKPLDGEDENLGEIRARLAEFEAGQSRVLAALKVR